MKLDPVAVQMFSSSGLVPILEFAGVAAVIVVTYLAIHNMFNHLKPATKMLVSMFFGSLAYSFGKLVVLTLIINPVIQSATSI